MQALAQPAAKPLVMVAGRARASLCLRAATRARPRLYGEIGNPAHGQARLLRGTGALQGGERAGHQVGVPPARQGLPSRPQRRRQDRRAQVQGAERGLRGPEGPAEACRLRPVRPRRLRRAAGRGGHGFGPDFASSMSDIFDDLFGEFMGGRRGSGQRSGRERGADLRYNMEITLPEAFAGKTAQIRVPTSVTCEACTGTGRQDAARSPPPARPAAAPARCAPARASSPSSAPARHARGAARSSTIRAAPAAARAA